jgi:DNA-binding NtrC family response regulator
MAKAKILVAEDDVTMVSLLETLLKMEGYEVVSLPSDADIPAAVRDITPDVILLDVYLSHQSGLDILEELKRSEDTSRVRVVMSSGANVKEECMRRGAYGFLPKPYMPEDLVEILKQAVQSV